MAEARSAEAWNHTASVLAMLINANPFRSGKPVKPVDLHPHHAAKAADSGPLKVGLDVLRDMVIRK